MNYRRQEQMNKQIIVFILFQPANLVILQEHPMNMSLSVKKPSWFLQTKTISKRTIFGRLVFCILILL